MGVISSIQEYAKLARSFNMMLTGVAPVFGALSMGEENLLLLGVLFLIGILAHIYGFVLNDYMDVKIDKLSMDLAQRPLISGTISRRMAFIFALSGVVLMFLLAGLIVKNPFPILILILAVLSATLYNLVSKKFPAMDFFVSGAIFFLILFGAAVVSSNLTLFAYIISLLGFLQVMFMNAVAAGLKDIDHDALGGGNTIAVKLGARVEKNGALYIPSTFKLCAYGMELTHITVVFLPFLLMLLETSAVQIAVLIFLSGIMLYISKLILDMKYFDREKLRKLIGLHYQVNYSLVPVMLASFNPYVLLLLLIPPAGFFFSNKLLHNDMLAPKTM